MKSIIEEPTPGDCRISLPEEVMQKLQVTEGDEITITIVDGEDGPFGILEKTGNLIGPRYIIRKA